MSKETLQNQENIKRAFAELLRNDSGEKNEFAETFIEAAEKVCTQPLANEIVKTGLDAWLASIEQP